MKEKGFNLSEVARKTGLDYQSLYTIELREIIPQISIISSNYSLLTA